MQKKSILLRTLHSLIHWTGLLYLSAFVLNIGILWFFVRNWIGCGFVEGQVVYVRCGDDLAGRFLEYFFLYLSPLVAPVYKFNLNLLFNRWAELSELQLWAVGVVTALMTLVFIASLVVLRQMVHGFVVHKKDRTFLPRAKRILLILLFPAFISFGYRLYLQPPSWVDTEIEINAWNGDFTVPRGVLKEWSLVDIERPAFKPNEYAARLGGRMRYIPYLKLYAPADLGLRQDNSLTVTVNPHYEVMNDKEREAARERYVENRLAVRNEEGGFQVYPKIKEARETWEIHQPQIKDEDFSDIYVWRDKKGDIENVLECTSMNACAVKTVFAEWVTYPCGKKMSCNCTRVCKELSMGVEDYNIRYSFDKKHLDRYPIFNTQIKNFVQSFYTDTTIAKK